MLRQYIIPSPFIQTTRIWNSGTRVISLDKNRQIWTIWGLMGCHCSMKLASEYFSTIYTASLALYHKMAKSEYSIKTDGKRDIETIVTWRRWCRLILYMIVHTAYLYRLNDILVKHLGWPTHVWRIQGAAYA